MNNDLSMRICENIGTWTDPLILLHSEDRATELSSCLPYTIAEPLGLVDSITRWLEQGAASALLDEAVYCNRASQRAVGVKSMRKSVGGEYLWLAGSNRVRSCHWDRFCLNAKYDENVLETRFPFVVPVDETRANLSTQSPRITLMKAKASVAVSLSALALWMITSFAFVVLSIGQI
jgi:hypothetical protein